MNIQFDVSKIKKTLEQANDLAQSQNFEGSEFTPVAFLPKGTHEIKFFFDPTSEIIRYFVMHKVGKFRTLCPRFVKGELVPDECLLDFLGSDKGLGKWKELGARKQCMIYGKLVDTNNPGEYWQKGKVYAIIGSQRLWKAMTSLLGMVDKNKEAQAYILNMLTPNLNGPVCKVDVIPGSGGAINISNLPGSTDPVFTEPPEWWKPLGEIYVSGSFNPADYKNTVKAGIAMFKKEIVEKGFHESNPLIGRLLEEVLDDEKNQPPEGGDPGYRGKAANQPAPQPAPINLSVSSSQADATPAKQEVPAPAPVASTPTPAPTPQVANPAEQPSAEITCEKFGQFDPNQPGCMVCKNNVECMKVVIDKGGKK